MNRSVNRFIYKVYILEHGWERLPLNSRSIRFSRNQDVAARGSALSRPHFSSPPTQVVRVVLPFSLSLSLWCIIYILYPLKAYLDSFQCLF